MKPKQLVADEGWMAGGNHIYCRSAEEMEQRSEYHMANCEQEQKRGDASSMVNCRKEQSTQHTHSTESEHFQGAQ